MKVSFCLKRGVSIPNDESDAKTTHPGCRSRWRLSVVCPILLTPLLSLATDSSGFPPVAPGAPFTPKVTSLEAALTLDEKISLVHGAVDPASLGQAGYLPGVPRLGIPVRRDADALGINVTADATALPSRIGLGASFDRTAVYAAGQLEGNEGRALGVDLIYGPQVDLTRLPNWGRNNTTFGEDPFSNGQLAIQEVIGIQSKGLMSEVKHFAFYNGQNGVPAPGTTVPAVPALPTIVDDQTAHELYLKAYEYPVTEGQPSSIMASHQGVQIVPSEPSAGWSSDNPLTLTTILRGQWHFPGFVLSDYFATRSVHAILSGLDQEYPGYFEAGLGFPIFFSTQLPALVNPASSSYNPLYALALDDAVAYVLYSYERFGLLESASPSGRMAGYSLPPRPNINNIKGQDAATTEQLSEESAVLLKNDGDSLPLKSSVLSSVAVIGPTARQVMVYGGGGERARGFPDRDAINPLQILEALAPAGSNFTYSPGIDWIGTVVPASELPGGLTRTESDSSATKIDTTVNYGASSNLKPGVTYTWTGTFNAPGADTYYFYLQGSIASGGGFGTPPPLSITIDGVAPTAFSPAVPVSTYPSDVVPSGGGSSGAMATLTAGPHKIVITASVPSTLATPVYFRFASSKLGDSINAAVGAASSAKVAVVFADDNGGTNSDLVNSLAQNEDALIEAVASANPHTIVVLSTGNPVLMPWVDKVKTILEMWYPGQEGGTSTARLLLGLANPGGKLPISWPVSADQTPFFNHPERVTGDGTAVYFSEGIYMGYRWYQQQNITPLFSFGHGLSYAKFSFSDLDIRPEEDHPEKDHAEKDRPEKEGLKVSFKLTNTGSVKGSEVPQVYLGPPSRPLPEVTQYAPQKLAGFERVELNPGETQTVDIHLSRLELSYWSTPAQAWVVATGPRNVYVGASSDDIRLQGKVLVGK